MKKIILATIISFLASCSEIIEPTLEKDKVNIIAPTDSLSNLYSQTFYWEKLENATRYQIQIASPSFQQAQRIITDTSTTAINFKITLVPAKYQFRIRAFNNSSNTDWTYKSIKIDSADLYSQTLILDAPINELYTNLSTLQLKWQSVFGAAKYKIQIDTVGSFNSSYLTTKTTPSIYYNLLNIKNETAYYWRVKALNTSDSTDWSDAYYFVYDNTAPSAIASAMPNDVSTKTYARDSVITWAASNESGASYTVKIQYGTGAAQQSIPANGNTYMKYSTTAAQKITYKILVTDKAGNVSPESSATVFSFYTR
jgi:hypothetical protein